MKPPVVGPTLVVGSVVFSGTKTGETHGPTSPQSVDPKFFDPSITPEINMTLLKEHALECSRKFRAGKFTRVGQDFSDEVLTDVECLIREIRGKFKTLHPPLEIDGSFIKGALLDKIAVELNRAIGRLIQNKVQKQPTVGVTLGRTR